MTTIGIVGAGIAGLHLALHLQQQGIGVTVYSDRTAEEVRGSRLPNSVALMGATRGRDTALGTNHWTSPEQGTWGMMLRIFGDPPLAFNAELSSPYLFIDMRVYLPRLMADFQERGGKIVFGPVGVDDVTTLSANHDLMVVAVGRAGLGDLFPRVAERSPYDGPQRRVVGGLFHGVSYPSPLRMGFNIIPGRGEIFENQFLTLDGYATGVLIEVIPGGGFDHLTSLRAEDDPVALSAAVLAIVKDYAPDTYARVDPAKFALTGPLNWLSGAVTPIARRGWAPLAGGKLAMAVGDAHITHDPITGQGANGASRGAFLLAELVEAQARAGGRFDEAFCVDAEQKLWDDSRAVTEWSNAFLQPPPPHAIGLLVAAAQNPAIANAFADNFNTPKQQWAVFCSPDATAAFIESFSAAPAS